MANALSSIAEIDDGELGGVLFFAGLLLFLVDLLTFLFDPPVDFFDPNVLIVEVEG